MLNTGSLYFMQVGSMQHVFHAPAYKRMHPCGCVAFPAYKRMHLHTTCMNSMQAIPTCGPDSAFPLCRWGNDL